MANPLRSTDDLIANAMQYGSLSSSGYVYASLGTAQTTTAGGAVTWHRFPQTYTVPTPTSPVTGWQVMSFNMAVTGSFGITVPCIETVLGTLTVSGNSFAAGSSMPSRAQYGGSSQQLNAGLVMLHVSGSMTATTPTITVTYANQDNTGSRSATVTLPTNAQVNSAYGWASRLQSGDHAVRSVSNMSISAGTAGTVRVLGLTPLMYGMGANTTTSLDGLPLSVKAIPAFSLAGGETIAFWTSSATTSSRSSMWHMELAPIT